VTAELTRGGPRPRLLCTVCADPAGPVPAALGTELGLAWPGTPGTLATGGDGGGNGEGGNGQGVSVLWLGPDEWLVLGGAWSAPAAAGLAARLRAAAPGPAAVVDVSAGWSVLTLAGAGVPDLLAGCCALDLHPRVCPPGRVAQTLLAGVPVVLAQPARAHWLLLVRPSVLAHVTGWLGYPGAG